MDESYTAEFVDEGVTFVVAANKSRIEAAEEAGLTYPTCVGWGVRGVCSGLCAEAD